MPQVPAYDGPQVRTQALQPVFQRAPDVSSGAQSIARGLGQVAEVADNLAQRQMRQQIETESNKLDTEITAGWLEWNTAALRNPAYRGEGVAQYEADAAKWWDDAKQKYTSVASPMVREQLGLSLGRKRTQAVGSVAGYVTQERERFADDQAEAAAQKTIEFGIDTGDTAGAAARVRQIAAEKGARKGWSTEMVMAEQQKYLGNLHLSHITRLAESNPAKAREYYEANKAEIPGTAQPRVEQVLKAEADNQFATQFAAGVAAKPLAEQLSEAAKIDNPERREKALTQIRNNHALVKAAQAEREQIVKDQAWQLVGQGKKVPEALLAQMDGRGRVELQDYLKTRAKQAAEGTQVKTDWATYIDTRERLAAGEKVNLVALTTKIAPAQMEQLLDIQTKAKTPEKQREVATAEQQLSAFVDGLQLKGEKDGKFKAAAYDLFNEHLRRTGKEPTFEERDKIMRDLNKVIVTKPGMIWDSKDPAYLADRDVRNKAIGVDQPPPAALPRVKSVAEARALKPGTVFIDPQGVERIR